MMRTPVCKANSKKPPIRDVHHAKSTQHGFSRQMSSHQMASILFNYSMSPVRRFSHSESTNEDKEKFAPDLDVWTGDKISGKDKPSDEHLSNSFHRTESSNKEFCKRFSVWMEETESKSNGSDFARLKVELLQLVGKYELEFSQKKN